MRKRATIIIAAFLALAAFSAAQTIDTSQWLKSSSKSDLSNKDIVAGLKDALKVGSGEAVSLTGRTDGYFGNAAIKILMPEKLASVEKGLRLLGQGEKVDEFVLSMNRAAEKAAPAAKDIFWDAITKMTFEDARKILGGGDTAATDYFRAKTGDALTVAFRPIVTDSMKDVGVVQQYKELQSSYASVPFASSLPSIDIETYVVGKALDGLFLVLGQEERKIRQDPAARVTDVLKLVFGK
ncbi:MAG TPA: DUF4197 domain-containing protein [Thermoanaerobaculia bacterium]|nr:DUF4197 domain-containing protein [Thermoanaerobaculia bacterium]